MEPKTQTQAPSVHRREVFYLPGYDPIPPRRYRELYRAEGAAQAAISGYAIKVTGRPGSEVYSWDVVLEETGMVTHTRVTFLKWNDIVQNSMQISILQTYLQMMATLWLYISSGALGRLFRLRPAPMIAALYPVSMLLSEFGVAALAGRFLRHWLLGLSGVPFIAALLAGLALTLAILIGFRRLDGPLYAYYLALDYIFTARDGGALPPPLAARQAEFVALVQASMAGDADEVLVVGHSTGAHLAVDLAAQVLRDAPETARLSLLTLGQVIPMVSFLPKATRLRRALHDLAGEGRLTWVDVSAPGDGACFALCDPVAVSGVAPPESEWLWPRMVSAAFSESLTPEHLHSTRWRFFRRHIQYLCAFDFPRWYDYFRITAGGHSLGQIYGQRGSTASRNTRPLSPFTDI